MDTQYKKSADGKTVTIISTATVDSAVLKKQIQDQIANLEKLASQQAAAIQSKIAALQTQLAQIQ